jgi:D-glycero-D-manno-heptose 1,7-bisphosphate phosphatase
MNGLVLIDRDGTINAEKHYLSSPDQIELLPGAAAGIRRLRELGLTVVVVTNQSAIGRGLFGADQLARIHERLLELLQPEQAVPHAIYVCPHHPDAGCSCRKPAPGLAHQAAVEFGASLADSFVVGDKACDMELGKRIGATTVLVRTGYGQQVVRAGTAPADHVVENLLAAARLIEQLVRQHSFGLEAS